MGRDIIIIDFHLPWPFRDVKDLVEDCLEVGWSTEEVKGHPDPFVDAILHYYASLGAVGLVDGDVMKSCLQVEG